MSPAWVWLREDVVVAIDEAQLAEHGGAAGTRDLGLLVSALNRPGNLDAYGTPDIAELAAAYGFGIARNHPFVDGNKRTAFVAVELFLALNGYSFSATDEGCILTMLTLAAGDMTEEEFATWLRTHTAKRA